LAVDIFTPLRKLALSFWSSALLVFHNPLLWKKEKLYNLRTNASHHVQKLSNKVILSLDDFKNVIFLRFRLLQLIVALYV
jgi:hypothetical protein